jgi:hypothetical protein
VTDAEIKIDDELHIEAPEQPTDSPEQIAVHYLTSIDEVVEHLRAASQLGLGVHVRSYLEADEDTDGLAERWEFELLTSSPVHHEDDLPEQAPEQ